MTMCDTVHLDTVHATKLQRALDTMIRTEITGKARDAFYAHDALGVAIDLLNGTLAPSHEDAIEITGIDELYLESVQQAERVLGMPTS